MNDRIKKKINVYFTRCSQPMFVGSFAFCFPFFEVDLLDFNTLIVTVFTLFHLAPSGSISWVTATPADVVKSRMQADTQLSRKYKGIVDCILHSYKTEGAQVNTRVRATANTNAVGGGGSLRKSSSFSKIHPLPN